MDMDDHDATRDFVVHLARLGLAGKPDDVQAYVKRIAKKLGKSDESLTKSLVALLVGPPPRSGRNARYECQSCARGFGLKAGTIASRVADPTEHQSNSSARCFLAIESNNI